MTGQVHALNHLKHCRGGDFVADLGRTTKGAIRRWSNSFGRRPKER